MKRLPLLTLCFTTLQAYTMHETANVPDLKTKLVALIALHSLPPNVKFCSELPLRYAYINGYREAYNKLSKNMQILLPNCIGRESLNFATEQYIKQNMKTTEIESAIKQFKNKHNLNEDCFQQKQPVKKKNNVSLKKLFKKVSYLFTW